MDGVQDQVKGVKSPLFLAAKDDLPPVCAICGFSAHWLGDHLSEKHDITAEEYLELHPGHPTASKALLVAHAARVAQLHAERTGPVLANLRVRFGGVPFPINFAVPREDCLPMPDHYKVPEFGSLALDVQDVSIALQSNRSIWVWGPPGTGKDAVFSAFSAMTRRPALLFTIVQGADITAWRFTRGFNAQGTFWEEGSLLKALRDGYLAEDGERYPYLLVFSDFDRATRAQAEELRQILDSIQGRVTGPTGEVWPVFPGTTIVATANSSGGGDTSGKFVSANPIDMSILDRFERKIYFHSMSEDDEKPVIIAKYPELARKSPDTVDQIFTATKAVRAAVAKELVFAEWGHRAVCNWASATEDLMRHLPDLDAPTALRRGMRVVLDGLPDADTREGVKRLIDPHIKGGAVDPGSTSHIDPDGLRLGPTP